MGNVEISQLGFTEPFLCFHLTWNHPSLFILQVFEHCLPDAIDKVHLRKETLFPSGHISRPLVGRNLPHSLLLGVQPHIILGPYTTFCAFMYKESLTLSLKVQSHMSWVNYPNFYLVLLFFPVIFQTKVWNKEPFRLRREKGEGSSREAISSFFLYLECSSCSSVHSISVSWDLLPMEY